MAAENPFRNFLRDEEQACSLFSLFQERDAWFAGNFRDRENEHVVPLLLTRLRRSDLPRGDIAKTVKWLYYVLIYGGNRHIESSDDLRRDVIACVRDVQRVTAGMYDCMSDPCQKIQKILDRLAPKDRDLRLPISSIIVVPSEQCALVARLRRRWVFWEAPRPWRERLARVRWSAEYIETICDAESLQSHVYFPAALGFLQEVGHILTPGEDTDISRATGRAFARMVMREENDTVRSNVPSGDGDIEYWRLMEHHSIMRNSVETVEALMALARCSEDALKSGRAVLRALFDDAVVV